MENLSDAGEKYQWLSTIDPYGNTIFSIRQVPSVIQELELLSSDTNSDVQKIIAKVVKFIHKIQQHYYVRFIGD